MEELSAVVLLQRILDDALRRRATDVHLHFHAAKPEVVVQFRVGGQLQPYLRLTDLGASIVRRIKALARMDVAESRVPQDGAFVWESEVMTCHVRAAVLPTIYGEAVVLRLLIQNKEPLTFTLLGMTQAQSDQVNRLLQRPSGLILVAGPTGSGKTTTLYAMMWQLARWGRHVVSIEDPVEMTLDMCQQVEVRERAGVTFDIGLKAALRQDPDAIMVGEIRDEETARVALRAALTGHLVLSTTHARDFVGAAARLVDFGVSRAVLGDVLAAVIAQSLQAHVCAYCSGNGCARCEGTGFSKERTARFWIEEMTPEWAARFASDAPWSALREELASIKQLHG